MLQANYSPVGKGALLAGRLAPDSVSYASRVRTRSSGYVISTAVPPAAEPAKRSSQGGMWWSSASGPYTPLAKSLR